MKEHLSHQFRGPLPSSPIGGYIDREDDDEGPYCANCSNDFEEVYDWLSRDRQETHPLKRVPCKGCGAV